MLNEVELKRVIKTNGERVRMADLKTGDVFDLFVGDEYEGRWVADEDGRVQTPEDNFGEEFIGIGAIMAHPYQENA